MSRPPIRPYCDWLERRGEVVPARLEAYRRHEAQVAMRQWFMAHLHETDPLPEQKCGSVLGSYIAWTTLAKRSGMARFFGRTSSIEKQRWGTVVHCAINARSADPRVLRRAIERMHQIQLRQMQSPDLKAAGIVLDAQVDDNSIIDLRAVVTDDVAIKKIRSATYTGVVLSLDGADIADVSLIDNPGAFDLEKASSGATIAKVFDGSRQVKKNRKMAAKIARAANVPYGVALACVQSVRKTGAPPQPRLPASALKAVDEVMRTATVLQNGGNGDMLAAKAAYDRARQAYGLELVKAARRPVAYGDAQMVGFLRGGRP